MKDFQEQPKEVRIVIQDMRSWTKWLRLLVAFSMCPFLLIGVGVYAESTAMQWMGFIMTLLFVAGFMVQNKDDTFTSKEAAIKFIQSLPN